MGTLIILFYIVVRTVGVRVINEPGIGGPRLAGILEAPGYPLGTNKLGKGLMVSLVHATPPMIKIIMAGAVFSTVIVVALGTVSGYKGGRIDAILSTLIDIAMTIPGLPLIILLIVTFQPSNPFLIGILLPINSWAGRVNDPAGCSYHPRCPLADENCVQNYPSVPVRRRRHPTPIEMPLHRADTPRNSAEPVGSEV